MIDRNLKFGILLLFGMAIPTGVQAQDRPGVLVADSTATFDFQQADLQIVIGALADVAGLNVIYGALPTRAVTLRTGRPVPLSEVRTLLESVARANGVTMIDEAGLVRFEMDEPDLQPQTAGGADSGATQDAEDRRLFVLGLRYARAEMIVQTVGALFGLDTRSLPGTRPGLGTVLSQELQRDLVPAFRPDDLGANPGQFVPGLAIVKVSRS